MSSEKKKEGNPYVSEKLCIARQKYFEEKVKGLEKTIIVGFSISTLLIAVFQLILEVI